MNCLAVIKKNFALIYIHIYIDINKTDDDIYEKRKEQEEKIMTIMIREHINHTFYQEIYMR